MKMKKNAKDLSNMSLVKNVYDTRKKKIRKKSTNNFNVREINNKSHHVLNNNSSNENFNVNNKKSIENKNCLFSNISENILHTNIDSVNDNFRPCYIRRKKFHIMIFLLLYYYSYCYFCCTLSTFGVVVLANNNNHNDIDEKINNNNNISKYNYNKEGVSSFTMVPMMTTIVQKRTRKARDIATEKLHEEHEYDDEEDEPDEDYDITKNKSAKGMYVGAPCEFTCNVKLHHVFCDPATNICGCEKNYPVVIDIRKGCAKPKKLGEQCLHHQICAYNDPNSLCVQIKHNAVCDCAQGYHSVSYMKPTKRIFCTQDIEIITSNLPTLLGVITSITVLGGLICMVLYLFSKNKYPRDRGYGDAHLSPPIMYASDTARPSSRSSQRSSGSISSYGHRRTSGVPLHGSKGVLVSASRTGAARSAAILLVSCHISAMNSPQNTNPLCGSKYNENMREYLKQQLEQQKQLLFLDIPALKNRKNFLSKLNRYAVNTTNVSATSNSNDSNLDDSDHQHYHIYENHNYCNNTSRGTSSFDGLDDRDDDWDEDLSAERFELAALPTPASEQAHVALKTLRLSSRRPSLASIQSTSSSVKSYSMKRFEQELQQKELRQEMKKQLTKLQEQQQLQRVKPCIIIGDAIPFTVTRTILPTPSPITPKSTDELLPSVCEEQEFSPKSQSSTKSSSSSNNFSKDDIFRTNRASTSKDLL
uniref:CSON000100 protein n=1 Tax=Culicoides sonorensis TaxID=179676 RepID=A0A336ME96_CULSO